MKRTTAVFSALFLTGILSAGTAAQAQGSSQPPVIRMNTVEGMPLTMSRTEVTQKAYTAVMGRNPSRFKGDDYPVTNVSWFDTLVFCNRLSMAYGLTPCYTVNGSTDPDEWGAVPQDALTSEWQAISCDFNATGYRLPTKEEWLYAARGGTNDKYSGSQYAGGVAWYKDNSERMPHEVANKFANGYDLYDMSGNVWEWCWDHFDIYSTDMGGSYSDDERFCIIDGRSGSIPMHTKTTSLGFRICRTAR